MCCRVCDNKPLVQFVPILLSMSCGGSRHADFEKIHSAFLAHYSKDPKLGESQYADWIKSSGLDETQSYYLQGATRANKSKESFEWVNFLLQFVKEDKDAMHYQAHSDILIREYNRLTGLSYAIPKYRGKIAPLRNEIEPTKSAMDSDYIVKCPAGNQFK